VHLLLDTGEQVMSLQSWSSVFIATARYTYSYTSRKCFGEVKERMKMELEMKKLEIQAYSIFCLF
jgi:hypothetical protein